MDGNKLALCIAGGGARGVIQAGYLKAIMQLGIKSDFVFGTSVGALNACLYAQGEIDKLEQLWLTVKNKDVYDFHFWVVPQMVVNRNHLYDTAPLAKLIEEYVDFPLLQEKGANLQVTATNLTDWTTESYGPRDLTEKEFKTFLLASASPPMAFPTVQFRGKEYGDGGLVNNFNVSNAVKAGADYILLVSPTLRDEVKTTNALDMFNVLTGLPEFCYLDRELGMIDKINQVQSNFPDLREIRHFILRPDVPSGIGLLDFDMKGVDRKALIEDSCAFAKEHLDNLFDSTQPREVK